jgi:hypothetical protein
MHDHQICVHHALTDIAGIPVHHARIQVVQTKVWRCICAHLLYSPITYIGSTHCPTKYYPWELLFQTNLRGTRCALVWTFGRIATLHLVPCCCIQLTTKRISSVRNKLACTRSARKIQLNLDFDFKRFNFLIAIRVFLSLQTDMGHHNLC